ncbi:hypothetical protein STEG23_029329, partial [Scotinomys teguina]
MKIIAKPPTFLGAMPPHLAFQSLHVTLLTHQVTPSIISLPVTQKIETRASPSLLLYLPPRVPRLTDNSYISSSWRSGVSSPCSLPRTPLTFLVPPSSPSQNQFSVSDFVLTFFDPFGVEFVQDNKYMTIQAIKKRELFSRILRVLAVKSKHVDRNICPKTSTGLPSQITAVAQ